MVTERAPGADRRTRTARAAVVALGVVAILVVQHLLAWALGWVMALALGQRVEGFAGLPQVLALAQALVFTWIPFGIGVFLGLALVAPLVPDRGIGRVLLRAVIAALVGALAAWLGTLLGDVLFGSLASELFPAPAPSMVGYELVASLQLFVASVPAVALVALLVATWRRLRPTADAPAATPAREV